MVLDIPKEKKEMTEDEKAAKSLRKQVQEKHPGKGRGLLYEGNRERGYHRR